MLKKIQPFNLDTTKSYTFNGASLGNVANVKISGGTSGQVLSTDGSGNLAWGSSGLTYTSGTLPPATAKNGDQWYNTSTNVLYEYINDGTTNYWVDIQTPSISANTVPVTTSTTSAAAKAMVMGLIFGG